MAAPKPDGPALVLVVEDNPLLMMAMVGFVENAGCEAVEASTIEEAIDLLEHRSDIRTVFTDLDMRGSTDAMKMAQAIRDRWPPIELLLISSMPWAEDDIPVRGILLSKPFDQRKIVIELKKMAA